MTQRPIPYLLSFFLLSGLGCDSEEPPVDAGTDAGTTMACEPLGAFELVTSDGVADALGAAVGTARAGRLAAADVPVDPSGLADARPDDFVLSNGRVAFIVSDTDAPAQVYDPYGGRIVGVGRVGDGAFVEIGDYNMLILALGRFTLATEGVTVLSDGSDGGPAVVRAVGTLTRVRALADLLDAIVPGDFDGLPAAIDYALSPDADALRVTLRVRASTAGLRATLGAVQAFLQAYRTQPWRPGLGFTESGSALPYLAFDDPRGTSFAWHGVDGQSIEPLIGTSGVDIFTSGRLILGPCDEGDLPLGELVLGGPGLPGLQAAVAAIDGTALRGLSGTVRNADGTPAPDVRLHVTATGDEHLTRFFPAADGSFAIDVDARAGQLWAWRAGQPLVGPLDASGGTVDVSMPATGTLVVEARDADAMTPLPARVEVFPSSGAPPEAPASFGELVPGRGRSLLLHPTDGVARLELLPGDYQVRVSRGPEYARVDTEVTVVAGTETPLVADLARVVPTPGVLCADYHIHTTRSIDSPDSGALKVAALVGDGLEIAIRSDHEWVNDFQPVIDDLGLGAWARGLTGLELTTFTWGHFGVFPLETDRARPSGGAFFWYDRNAPDVFDEVRARPEAPALIINHPRAGGIRQAYFTEAGYDPVTGTIARPELWDEAFNVVEVFNDGDFERFRDSTVQDWFALLRQGRRVFAVGSSDSHDVTSAPVGWPRTCLRVGMDDPAAISPQQVRDATVAGHSTINGGIYMDVTAPGGVGPGDEATGTGDRASLDVRLFAAPHVVVDRLEVIVDGETTETISIGPGDAVDDIERLHATVEVDVAASGSWVVLHAASDTPFDTNGHRPFVVSNPIYLRR
ncbi:MAG: CehA/McbA family metallohydrolase [Sandaracinaceae bacterium]|nr:CehA/McbA family metallohydrolase [Sandaracinaceae bacterium]